jgi:hypothetical protein
MADTIKTIASYYYPCSYHNRLSDFTGHALAPAILSNIYTGATGTRNLD